MVKQAPSNFHARLLSAVILAPIALLVVWAGGIVFVLAATLLAVIIYWEWIVMSLFSVNVHRDFVALLSLVGMALAVFFTNQPVFVFVCFLLILLSTLLVSRQPVLGKAVAGVGVAGAFVCSVVYLRQVPQDGLALLIMLLFTVWAADVFAYGFGKTIGGPKLMPKVSPNKTWAGFFGGLIGAFVSGVFIAHYAFGVSLGAVFFLSMALALAAQAGDLMESAAKRRFGIKDTSNIIPGHGGVLDRVDGLTLAAATLVLFYAGGWISL